MIKYVYPHLPSIRTYPFIRIAGSGLANSLFVFARAVIFAEEHQCELINPTWLNFDPVQWKLWSKDKRTYYGIFKNIGVSGFRKFCILLFKKKIREEDYIDNNADAEWVEIFYMRGFETLRMKSEQVRTRLLSCLTERITRTIVGYNFSKKIAVHIRMGDYGPSSRMPLDYYKSLVEKIHEQKTEYEFLIFSDGKDRELQDILALPYVKRVYFGSAMSDILAMSRCNALIGSVSTFSDMGAYLGQLPTLSPRKPQYGCFLEDERDLYITDGATDVPERFLLNL